MTIPFTKIWERYFFAELIKSTLFFLFTFYGLYVLIDYANHAASFHRHHIQFHWGETSLYYSCELIRRLNILLPLALLLAAIRLLCQLNTHNELIALMSSGISKKTLMRPLLCLGILGTLLLYINAEVVFPAALNKLKRIEDSRSNRSKHHKTTAANHLALEDHSILLFQNYDTDQQRFFDSYWIRNANDIYRIKYLYTHLDQNTPPTGHYVEHLTRDSTGQLITVASLQEQPFPEIHFKTQTLFDTITPPEELSLSELWQQLPSGYVSKSEKESQVIAAFYHKLFMPWICLLAVIGAAPFCLQITRNLPIFFIYAGSIFGLLAFDLVLSAAVLLAKRQVLPPHHAIVVPFGLFSGLLFWKYSRL